MLKNITEANTAPDAGPEPSVAEELLAAIKLATQEFKSCEVVTDLRLATKFLKSCGFSPKPFREGILLSFARANIYIHNP
jgi:hypothetical protein